MADEPHKQLLDELNKHLIQPDHNSSPGDISMANSGEGSAARSNPFSFSFSSAPQSNTMNFGFGQRGGATTFGGSSTTLSSGFSYSSPLAATAGPSSTSRQAKNTFQPKGFQPIPKTAHTSYGDQFITNTRALEFGYSQDVLNTTTSGYLQLLRAGSVDSNGSSTDSAKLAEIRTCPLFSEQVRIALRGGILQGSGSDEDPFPQFGLLGIREETYNSTHSDGRQTSPIEQNLVFANMNAPWSAFICGSQGAGKSHTLSCMLENSLLTTSTAGANPRPLAGLVFHFDHFTGPDSTQVCEAAYLCSSGVPVRVLVSPTNYHMMKKLYHNLPGLPSNSPKPEVIPLRFSEQQLNSTRMMTLMAVREDTQPPLYLEVVYKVLRDMSMEMKGAGGLDYGEFKSRLSSQGFSEAQSGPLRLRLQLLEEYLAAREQTIRSKAVLDSMFKSTQGSLTIVDLSGPFVNENDACALFNICLSIFMENRGECGRIIALDEAHKFLTKTGEAEKLTEQLVSLIRQQRHLATRVIIATQEPTLSPTLLDLCNVSIVHRFNSPAWYKVLRDHLAGACLNFRSDGEELFATIVGLQPGHALIFCPSALLDVAGGNVATLKNSFFRIRIRARITVDGGRSIMASDDTKVVQMQDSTAEELVRPFSLPAPVPAISLQALKVHGHGTIQATSKTPAGARSFPRPAPAAANSTTPSTSSKAGQNKPPTEPRALKRSDNSPAMVKKSAPPDSASERARATAFLEEATTKCLLAKPRELCYSTVHEEASRASGWPKERLSGKWANNIIRDQMTKHTKAYGTTPPMMFA
ncbi:hypothetical protein KCU88_g6032, partial [Aureobasidium melanogenum]